MRYLILILIGLLPVTGWAQAALVAACDTAHNTSNNSAITTGIDSTGATLLTITRSGFSGTSICGDTVTDSNNNRWKCVGNYNTGSIFSGIWYSYDSPAPGGGSALVVGAGHTVTVQNVGGTGSSYPAIIVRAYSGTITGADPLRTQVGNTAASGTTVTTGSLATIFTHDLVLSGVAGGGAASTPAIDSPLTTDCTLPGVVSQYEAVGNAYQLNAAGTSLNQTWSGMVSGPNAAIIAAFKTPGSVAPPKIRHRVTGQ